MRPGGADAPPGRNPRNNRRISTMFESIAIKAAPILALLGFAIGGSQAHSVAEPLRCEIEASVRGRDDLARRDRLRRNMRSAAPTPSTSSRRAAAAAPTSARAAPSRPDPTARSRSAASCSAASGAYDASLTLDADGDDDRMRGADRWHPLIRLQTSTDFGEGSGQPGPFFFAGQRNPAPKMNTALRTSSARRPA